MPSAKGKLTADLLMAAWSRSLLVSMPTANRNATIPHVDGESIIPKMGVGRAGNG